MSLELRILSNTYSPANRCIYCGATDGPLGEEHIIPLSLGGRLILPDASCRDCEKITGRFETAVARTMMGNFRIVMGFPTRRPKERPTHLTANVRSTSGLFERIEVPASDFPATIFFPNLPCAPA